MGDAASLRSILLQTNNTAPSIQNSASTMMRLYDRSSSLAVSEWRNSLQTCTKSQLLPLLYVANEVLQTSKRNRGNKFLEAFSPVLSSSLQFICERDGSIVEKVRRTAKIWGDRRVFSVRFVGELLSGLEGFRNGSAAIAAAANANANVSSAAGGGGGASQAVDGGGGRKKLLSGGNTKLKSAAEEDDSSSSSSSSSSVASSPFLGGDANSSLLDITVKIDKSALSAAAANKPNVKKRRRGSGGSADGLVDSASAAATKSTNGTTTTATKDAKNAKTDASNSTSTSVVKRPKVYTTDTLLSLLQHTQSLDDSYNSSLGTLSSIPPANISTDEGAIQDVVGSELITMHAQVLKDVKVCRDIQRNLYKVAEERRSVEVEAVRYVPWLKGSMGVDEDELGFCDGLLEKIELLRVIHADAKAARDKKRDDEARQRALEEAEARRREEEEERKRGLEDAMKSKEMEAKPGMVWNKQLREYQYLHDHTEESWRD